MNIITSARQHRRKQGTTQIASPQSFLNGELGGVWDVGYDKNRFQDTTATIANIGDGSILGCIKDSSPNQNHFFATANTTAPYCRKINNTLCAYSVGNSTAINAFTLTTRFASPLGNNCSIGVAYPGGGMQLFTGLTIANSYTISVPFSYLVIVNRAFTSAEISLWRPYLYFRSGVAETDMYFHIDHDGQSLSIGGVCNATADVIPVNYDSNVLMLNCNSGNTPGPRPHLDQETTNVDHGIDMSLVDGTLVPLVERVITSGVTSKLGETQLTGEMHQFLYHAPSTAHFVVGCHGRGSATYDSINGATPYVGPDSIDTTAHFNNGQVIQDRIRATVEALGKVYIYEANEPTHGEADAAANRTRAQYLTSCQNWPKDQLEHTHDGFRRLFLPQFISQLSDGCYGTCRQISLAQMDAHSPANLRFLVAPKYDTAAVSTNPAHLTAASYRYVGEMRGKVRSVVYKTGTWSPLYPISATRSGTVINVVFNVPVAPLVLDTTLVSLATSYGFTYSDSGGTIGISSVVLHGDGVSIDVTLTGNPAGNTSRLLSLGNSQVSVNYGPILGLRTNIRDSDPAIGQLTGRNLYNWCCISEVVIP